jgi:hypothetical protein
MNRTFAFLVMSFIAACVAHAEDPRTALISRAAAVWTEKDAEAVIAAAARESPSAVDLVTGITRHNLAVADPSLWAASAIQTLERCAKTGDPIAMAYHGSALTIRAGMKSGKGDAAGASADLEAGFSLMDKAVRAAPNAIMLRFMRAENAASTSEQSPFPRWDVAAQDVAVIEKSAAALSAEDRAGLELLKARMALGRGDAGEGMRRLEAAIRTAPASRSAETARGMLAELEE